MRSKLLICSALLFAALPARAADRVDYLKQIKPILAEKCFACHGALKQESDLRLDAASLILKGGASGAAVVPGQAGESHLIERVSAEDEFLRMPPEGEGEPLSTEQLSLVRRWIDQGAAAPDEAIPPDPRLHWAYQPPVRPQIPQPAGDGWVRNDLDALLAAAHAKQGLTPAPPASKEQLLRRVSFDLVGLPPTRSELRAFLDDASPDAYEKVVERLLASERYGERWGRHWMDVWRYSDWAGFGAEIRYSQKHVWRWRDWIIESLNADKGYNRMIVEMLAADELAPADADAARATGFLARNWYKFDRNVWLDDAIDHTGRAFLGMTFKCASCHDHKYDPIAQVEYYRLRAVFEPYDVRTDHVPGQLNVEADGLARVHDAHPQTATYLFTRGDPKKPDKEHPLEPGVPAIVAGPEFRIEPVSLPLESYYPALRPFVADGMIEQAKKEVVAAESNLAEAQKQPAGTEQGVPLAEKKLMTARAKLAAVEARIAAERAKHGVGTQGPAAANVEELAAAATAAERAAALAQAAENHLAAGQELDRAKAAATAGDEKSKQAADAAEKKLQAAKQALDAAEKAAAEETKTYQPLGPTYNTTSTGRRLALAKWIADSRNPLTARVAVNHIWLRHFGAPLVEKVDDFGLRSEQPPLAELLDYLAVELMDHNWSMKHVHRLIVTSSAYRMSSRAPAGGTPAVVVQPSRLPMDSSSQAAGGTPAPQPAPQTAIDRDNQFFWRMNPQRMEAEAVRDSLLYVAGSLDLTQGGPDIDHNQGLSVPRRSLYFRHARERQMPFLMMFDAANPRECYRRQDSIRPQQAFAMVNSSLALAQSRLLAGRLMKEADGAAQAPVDDDFIVAAFEAILSRRPSDAEAAACREFLAQQAARLADPQKLEPLGTTDNAVAASGDPAQRARENLVLVLFSHNDFVTIR